MLRQVRWPLLGLVLLLATSATAADAPAIGWQEAVARLAAERTRAETCAELLKRYGNEAARAKGEMVYGEAKAEVDGVIGGLTVALAKHTEPGSLPDLEERLKRGVAKRKAFCAEAQRLAPPPQQAGEKGGITDLVGGAIGPLVDALVKLWTDARHLAAENDRLTGKTIQTQLEAATWPAFAAIAPAS